MTKAVIIAGDFRTFQHSIQSAKDFLQDADIFVSVWESSNFQHQVEPEKIYSCGSITREQVLEYLKPYRVCGIEIEAYDAAYWRPFGYNANFLHRMRRGIDMMRGTGKEYSSVLFMRPDLFFGENTELMSLVANVQPGQFVTILSNEERVNVNKTLNDTLFATHYADVDKAVPTVEFFQNHKHEDWHTFYRNFVIGNGLAVVNAEQIQCVILRPPASADMTYASAIHNSNEWDNKYIFKTIKDFGLMRAVKDWSDTGVYRALKSQGETTALVVIGKMRNTSVARHSLALWPTDHRYLITWDDSDEIQEYTEYLQPKKVVRVPVAEYTTPKVEYLPEINSYRMLHLFQKLSEIPNIYDRYIVIRPDIFYWGKFPEIDQRVVFSLTPLGPSSCQDQLFVVNRYGKQLLSHLKFEAEKLSEPIDIHEFIGKYFMDRAIEFRSDEFAQSIQPYIQRDNLRTTEKDGFNFHTAVAVYSHALIDWRQRFGLIYEGLIPKHPDEAQR